MALNTCRSPITDMVQEENLQGELQRESAEIARGCTYEDGYIRQRLFSCLTCCKQGKMGICTACSIDCHKDHELVDMWEKRHFRCDCGTACCGSEQICKCSLSAEGNSKGGVINSENKYSRNFFGKFCDCETPYYPDDEGQEDMLQCPVCEDWFHMECLKKKYEMADFIPQAENVHGFVCGSCIGKHEFLKIYARLLDAKDFDIVKEEEGSKCKLAQLKKLESEKERAVGIWNGDWRHALCRCSECVNMYAEEEVSYLIDETDMQQESEEVLDEKDETLVNASDIDILGSVPLPLQGAVAQGIVDMKEELFRYLEPLRQTDTIVTKRHIDEFFQEFTSKRRKLE